MNAENMTAIAPAQASHVRVPTRGTDWARPFARAISAKVETLDLGLSFVQVRRLRESIGDDIRKYSDCHTPAASEAALEVAAPLGIDLYNMHWHNQKKFDPGRAVFVFEHVVPVGMIRDECIAARSENAIMDVLMKRTCVAWILRSEDALLNRHGYRRKRPPHAYEDVGINLIPFSGDLPNI
jgi:hypothetical protein